MFYSRNILFEKFFQRQTHRFGDHPISVIFYKEISLLVLSALTRITERTSQPTETWAKLHQGHSLFMRLRYTKLRERD
jgi:hypothetical protein